MPSVVTTPTASFQSLQAPTFLPDVSANRAAAARLPLTLTTTLGMSHATANRCWKTVSFKNTFY